MSLKADQPIIASPSSAGAREGSPSKRHSSRGNSKSPAGEPTTSAAPKSCTSEIAGGSSPDGEQPVERTAVAISNGATDRMIEWWFAKQLLNVLNDMVGYPSE